MKSAGSYIFSFIVSILLVFTLIGSAVCIVADSFAKPEKLIELTEKKDIDGLVRKELEKYFNEKYAATGIPANVYMDALDEEYLMHIINNRIMFGFSALGHENLASDLDVYFKQPSELEQNISDFYREYAESIDYTINDKYLEKLAKAKDNANNVVEEYCDVFKFTSLVKHGVIAKIKPLYERLTFIKILCIGASAVLALILVICNFRRVKDTLYWLGAAFISAGVLGAVPCIYFIATDYFSAFTIKQAQIYTAYTSAMRAVTDNFLTICIIMACVAVVLFLLYGICTAVGEKSDKKAASNEITAVS